MDQGSVTQGKHTMSNTTLRTITLETVANYRQVAEHAVEAYRASGHRLIAMVRRSLDRGTQRVAPQFDPCLRAILALAQQLQGCRVGAAGRCPAQG